MSPAALLSSLPPVFWAVLAALFLWWFSTGVLFWLAGPRERGRGQPRRTGIVALSAALLATALATATAVAGHASVLTAYASFLGGLGAWAFIELTFLSGLLTGPVRTPCPPGLSGTRRFVRALGTLLWHELAILGLGALMIWLTWGMPKRLRIRSTRARGFIFMERKARTFSSFSRLISVGRKLPTR